jgi:F-type H+-transporting ATPase subunit delta
MIASEIDRAYAEALIDLGSELDTDVYKDLTSFNEVINSSNDLETLLFSSVFTNDEKKDVLKGIFEKTNSSKVIQNFLYFLIDEKRIGQLPTIYKEVVVFDDNKKGFLKGWIESKDGNVDKDAKKILVNALKAKLNCEIELETKINNKITAGYKVTVGDYQIDATVDQRFEQIKKQILAE